MKYLKYLQKPLPYILIGLIVLIPFVLYYLKFERVSIKVNDYFPGDEERWGQFGDFVGGILNSTLTAILLFFSIWSFYRSQNESKILSEKANELTKKANNLSKEALFLTRQTNRDSQSLAINLQERSEKLLIRQVRPFPTTNMSYNDKEFIFSLSNNGLGVLIIKEIKFVKDGVEHQYLRNFFKDLIQIHSFWCKLSDYNINNEDKIIIPPNSTFLILEVYDDEDRLSYDPRKHSLLRAIYKEMHRMEIHLEYTDIFGNNYSFMNIITFTDLHLL